MLTRRAGKISRMREEALALRESARACEADVAMGSTRMAGYAEAFRYMADEIEEKITELERVS
ncbi:MAG: hypothetical protein ACXWXS_04165 [Actinomycetota bacterium]